MLVKEKERGVLKDEMQKNQNQKLHFFFSSKSWGGADRHFTEFRFFFFHFHPSLSFHSRSLARAASSVYLLFLHRAFFMPPPEE